MSDDIKALVSELETEARRHFGKTKPLEDHLEWRAAAALTRMAEAVALCDANEDHHRECAIHAEAAERQRDEAIAALRNLLAASEDHIFDDECLAEREAARAIISKEKS